jgi:hypothetical protein
MVINSRNISSSLSLYYLRIINLIFTLSSMVTSTPSPDLITWTRL